jgi:hypothetical protein
MTQQIKPKKCGENNWYIPNKKGFVPEIGDTYFYREWKNVLNTRHNESLVDYALIGSGNCFETEQEAEDAEFNPVDPTPLTWDELCEIAKHDTQSIIFQIYQASGGVAVTRAYFNAGIVLAGGRLIFESGQKYWRSKESLEAWIEKQKGDLNER